MKALIWTKYGPPNYLKLEEIDKPIPEYNEVLIKIHATTVNRTDCAMIRAKPFVVRFFTGIFKPKYLISGTDFAGQIESIGKDVSSFNVGDKVFGFSESDLGSHAEYLLLSENKAMVLIPENISYEEAAATSEGVYYAYNFINKIDLKKGQKVLVNGATGTIGSAAVQLLKHFEAEITAVCGTKNIELVKSLGAVKVFDYTKEDFTQDDQKYNYIFDAVGKSSFSKCKPLLLPGGVYISSELGYLAQNLFLPIFTKIFSNKKVIFPFPVDLKGCLNLAKELLEKGEFKPLIDRKYSLEQIVDAYKYVETGQKIGNVVINVGHRK